ncbi:15871_t:CDS:2, partial [Acaulospora morrowiae]
DPAETSRRAKTNQTKSNLLDESLEDEFTKVSTTQRKQLRQLRQLNERTYVNDDCIEFGKFGKSKQHRTSTILDLESLVIGNFKVGNFEESSDKRKNSTIEANFQILTMMFDPLTEAVCFELGDDKLEIQVAGIEGYKMDGRLIELKLCVDLVKWVLPVRRIDSLGNVKISIDPTHGELFKADKIVIKVSSWIPEVKLNKIHMEFSCLKENPLPVSTIICKGDTKVFPKSSLYEFVYQFLTILDHFLIMIRRKHSCNEINLPLRYVLGSEIVEIWNEDDWDFCKLVCEKKEYSRLEEFITEKCVLEIYIDDVEGTKGELD